MPYSDNEKRKTNAKKNREKINAQQRARRKADPEKYRNYGKKKYDSYSPERKKELQQITRKYHINHPERAMLLRARKRATDQNVPFDIIETDILIPTHCPILDIPLQRGTTHPKGNSPSLDKIEPAKGYVRGNIQVISKRANLMKSDATKEELLKFAHWILNDMG